MADHIYDTVCNLKYSEQSKNTKSKLTMLCCLLSSTSLQAGSSCLQFGVRSYLHHFYEECSSSMWERDPEDQGFVQSHRSTSRWNSAVWKVEDLHFLHHLFINIVCPF